MVWSVFAVCTPLCRICYKLKMTGWNYRYRIFEIACNKFFSQKAEVSGPLLCTRKSLPVLRFLSATTKSSHFGWLLTGGSTVFIFWPNSLALINLAPVVRNMDNAIHRINHYPVDSAIGFRNVYPVDRAIQRLNNRGLAGEKWSNYG